MNSRFLFVLSIVAWIVVFAFPINSQAVEKMDGGTTVLIDKNNFNGSFEDGSEKPWVIYTWESAPLNPPPAADAPASQVVQNKKIAKEGEYFFHAKVSGGTGRHVVKLVIDLPLTDPESGRAMILSLDLAGAGEHPVQIFSCEFVFMNGNQFVGLGEGGEQGPRIEADQWVHWESGPVKPPTVWTGGALQLRLMFIVDNGIEGLTYEAYLDNIRLVQTGGKAPSPSKK